MTDNSATRPTVFSPEDVASINRAYEKALAMMATEGKHPQTRAKLAENVMFLARSGENDEGRIAALAVIRTLSRKPAEVVVYTGL